jgi:hypothetical protein
MVLLGASTSEQGDTLHLHELALRRGPVASPGFRAQSAVLDPKGELFAAVTSSSPGGIADTIRVWRTAEPQDPWEFNGYLAAFSDDGRWLATAERVLETGPS